MVEIDDPYLDIEAAAAYLTSRGIKKSTKAMAQMATRKLLPFKPVLGGQKLFIKKSVLELHLEGQLDAEPTAHQRPKIRYRRPKKEPQKNRTQVGDGRGTQGKP